MMTSRENDLYVYVMIDDFKNFKSSVTRVEKKVLLLIYTYQIITTFIYVNFMY